MLYTLLTENDARYREPLQQQFPDQHFHVRPGVWLIAANDTMSAVRSRLAGDERDHTDDGLVILAGLQLVRPQVGAPGGLAVPIVTGRVVTSR